MIYFIIALAFFSSKSFAFAPGTTCGNDHPHYSNEVNAVPVVVPQEYHEDDKRILQSCSGIECSQTYSSTTWVPLTASTSKPIRIRILWDVIAGGDIGVCDDGTTGPCTYQCSTSSTSGVMVKQSDGVTYSSSGFSCSSSDATGTVIPSSVSPSSPMSLNMQIMVSRTQEAVSYWQNMLRVVPVQNPITISTTTLGNSASAITKHLPSSALLQSDTDLVVIMTARPSPNSAISGYAICLQQDQYGRCTVGQFNWVPAVLNQAGFLASTDSSRESELHTALHELAHVFGAMGPGSTQSGSNFVNSLDGRRMPTASVLTVLNDDPAFPSGSSKPVSYISSPKVKNLTRFYYDCPTAYGFPLEDVPLGKGAHWEARVAGPELMSYGSNSGQVYVSDLTLAYLEDTNHYIANYSLAGWLFSPTYNDFGQAGTATAFLGTDGLPYVPPSPISPGTPRWGYKAGCNWLGQAVNNPVLSASILPPYSCSLQNQYTCTSDNRMSAVCVVQSTYTTVTDKPSYGNYIQLQSGASGSGGPQAIQTPNSKSGYVNTLPLWAQWFSDAGAASANPSVSGATAANTGGYNDAMDYMPVPVGYWSCSFQVASSNSTPSGGGFSLSSISSSFGSSNDMKVFGGQARCPNCRCMYSSLMEMSSMNFNSKFPAYGLCYRTNCASTGYLQVAIKGQLDGATYWYQCPQAGGKLYIPGFFGALTCPAATNFCKLETISGLRYPEQDVYWEWIFWILICGSTVIVFFVCGCPCIRDKCINCCKSVCGARTFEPPGGHNDVNEPLPPIAARSLMVISILTLLSGMGIAGTMAWIIKTTLVLTGTIDVLGVGIMLLAVSTFGLCGSCKQAEHGPSCWALTYFFFDLLLILLVAFVTIWQFQFSSWTNTVTTYYQGIVAAGFYKPINATTTENIALAVAKVNSNMTALMGLCIVLVLLLFVGLIASGQLIKLRVLVAVTMSFINNLLLGFGLLIMAALIYIFVKNGTVLAGMYDVMGYILGLSLIFICVSITGHCTVRHKSFPLLMVYLFFSLALIGACAGGVWLCFNNVALVSTWVQNVSDNTLGPVATSLGMSGNKASILSSLQANLQKLGLACGIILITQVISVICAAFFGCAAKAWRIQHGLLQKPHQALDPHSLPYRNYQGPQGGHYQGPQGGHYQGPQGGHYQGPQGGHNMGAVV